MYKLILTIMQKYDSCVSENRLCHFHARNETCVKGNQFLHQYRVCNLIEYDNKIIYMYMYITSTILMIILTMLQFQNILHIFGIGHAAINLVHCTMDHDSRHRPTQYSLNDSCFVFGSVGARSVVYRMSAT